MGTDLFNPNGELLRERGTSVRGGQKVVMLELGDSGVLVEIKMLGGVRGEALVARIQEEAGESEEDELGLDELHVMPELGYEGLDKLQAWLYAPSYAPFVARFLRCAKLDPEVALRALKGAMLARVPVMPVSCPRCNRAYLDQGNPWETAPHSTHLCLACGEKFRLGVKAVGNPL